MCSCGAAEAYHIFPPRQLGQGEFPTVSASELALHKEITHIPPPPPAGVLIVRDPFALCCCFDCCVFMKSARGARTTGNAFWF